VKVWTKSDIDLLVATPRSGQLITVLDADCEWTHCTYCSGTRPVDSGADIFAGQYLSNPRHRQHESPADALDAAGGLKWLG